MFGRKENECCKAAFRIPQSEIMRVLLIVDKGGTLP